MLSYDVFEVRHVSPLASFSRALSLASLSSYSRSNREAVL